MNIEKIVFYATKTTTFKVVISKEEGYDMPETPKELVELINTIQNNPVRELAWNNKNVIGDTIIIDDYEVKEQ